MSGNVKNAQIASVKVQYLDKQKKAGCNEHRI
ncbi:protein [Escherichia coli]|nr:protein [Escherichia coli]